MTHVSRFPIHKDVYFEILDALYWLMADIKKSSEMKDFLEDFFTKTERLMLAKRLALYGMILEGYDIDVIKRTLKVSTETIYRSKHSIDSSSKGLKFSIQRLFRKESFENFLKTIFVPESQRFSHPLADS